MKKTLKKNSIVICCYNRPKHLKKLINSIKDIKDRKLYFISDGPKNEEDNLNVNKVRNLINSLKFNKKIILFKKNIGLPNIFIKGISQVFKFEKQIIILEDDTIPSKTFLKYCDTLLDKYKDNKIISQISGCNLKTELTSKEKEDYFFSKYSNIWGWATWKDRWIHYDAKFSNFEKLVRSKYFKELCNIKSEYKFWFKYFGIHKYDKTRAKDWDYAWTYTNFKKKRVSIVPKLNLIKNIGDDVKSGENPKKSYKLRTFNFKFPLKHPDIIKKNLNYDNFCANNIYSIPKLSWRIKKKIIKLFKIKK